jgi:hypothetical protein
MLDRTQHNKRMCNEETNKWHPRVPDLAPHTRFHHLARFMQSLLIVAGTRLAR